MNKLINIAKIFATPSILLLGFCSCCTKKGGDDPKKGEPKIVCPLEQQATQHLSLADGCTTIIYKNFTFSGFEVDDPTQIFVNMQGFEDYAVSCRGSIKKTITNFNKDLHSFDIQIDFINVNPSDQIVSTLFSFYYKSTSIPTDANQFNVLLSGEATIPEVFQPAKQTIKTEWASGTFWTKIEGFGYKGFYDLNNLEAIPVFDESDGKFRCSIQKSETEQEKFSVYLYAYDAPLKSITGMINFRLNGKLIKSETVSYSFELSQESSVPDFRTDDWWQIGKCARTKGIEGLQERYHIKSFIGLRKTIPLTINEKTINHTVTVIGESHDRLYNQQTLEGEKASLTFAFDQVITFEQNSANSNETYASYKKRWNDKNTNDWNENILTETGHSEIRYWLNNEFKDNIMPYEISGYLPKVQKQTTFFSSKTIVTSNDYIFLPSICEFGGVVEKDSALSKEGACYEYFAKNKTNNASKLRQKTIVNGLNIESYCFRTPSLNTQTLVYGCQNGSIVLDPYTFSVNLTNCIAPCFCL